MAKPKIIFVLEEGNFFKGVKGVLPDNDKYDIIFASDFESAEIYLNEIEANFQGIFLNPNSFKRKAFTLIKACHTNHNSVPLYILNNQFEDWVDDLSKRPIGIQEILHDAKKVVETILELEAGMVPIAEITSKLKKEPVKEQFPDHDDYFSIRVENFVCGKRSIFDVYLRLGENKFVKVANKNEAFQCDQLKNYVDHGLAFLFVLKEQRDYYIEQVQKEFDESLHSTQISRYAKVSNTLNIGAQVFNVLIDNGVNPQSIELSMKYVENTKKLINKIGTNNKVLNNILSCMPNFDHSTNVAFFAVLMGEYFDLSEKECVEELGLAAYLHDIGLFLPDNKFSHYSDFENKKDEQEILNIISNDKTQDEKREFLSELYKVHPERGSELLKSIEDIDPVCAQIVFQHHMRTNTSGFPKLPKGQTIHPLASIVGISDAMINIILNKKGPMNVKEEINGLTGFAGDTKRLLQKVFDKP